MTWLHAKWAALIVGPLVAVVVLVVEVGMAAR